MRILLIVDDYLPESVKIAGKMMHELAIELVHQGHEVTVLSPNTKDDIPLVSNIDGVEVLRFRSGGIKNVSKSRRLINEMRLSSLAWRQLGSILQSKKYDRIVFYNPSIFWVGLVSRLKRLWGCDAYMILRDIFPQWAIDSGLLSPASPLTFFLRMTAVRNYRTADRIAVQSPANVPMLSRFSSKVEVLYNWAHESPLPPIQKEPKVHMAQLGIQEKTVFFYGGNIGHAQDMTNIIRLADSLRTECFAHFLLVGNGDEFEVVRNEIRKRGLNNVSLCESVSQEVYEEMLAECDIGLISLNALHTAHNFPGKLLGYLNAGKPVLASINKGNDLRILLEQANAGLVSWNGDDELLLSNAKQLYFDSKLRLEFGIKGRTLLATHFSVKSAAKQVSRAF